MRCGKRPLIIVLCSSIIIKCQRVHEMHEICQIQKFCLRDTTLPIERTSNEDHIYHISWCQSGFSEPKLNKEDDAIIRICLKTLPEGLNPSLRISVTAGHLRDIWSRSLPVELEWFLRCGKRPLNIVSCSFMIIKCHIVWKLACLECSFIFLCGTFGRALFRES